MFIRKIIFTHVNKQQIYFKTIGFKSDMVEDSPLGIYIHTTKVIHIYGSIKWGMC